MQKKKIKSIIKQGEGMHVEFKECRDKLSKEVFETVCAFLNRFGGELLLGVNDASKIIGINKEKEIGRADELGSGVKKLFKYCKIYSGSDPELIEEDIFKTIIPLGRETEAKTGGIKGGAKGGIKGGVKLSNRQKEIVVNMQKNPTIT
ncbi:MAG: putative DNA binding domain-containing protein, partial [Candidatus Omnitrophota bacterium]